MKKFLILVVFVLIGFSCRNNGINKETILDEKEEILDEKEEIILDEQEDGIVPSTLDQIVTIFELKFNETKHFSFDMMEFKISAIDVIDHRMPCDVLDDPGPEFLDSIRIHIYFKFESNGNKSNLKVSSIQCGTVWWNMQKIREEMEKWHSSPNPNYFEQSFPEIFGNGVRLVDSPFSLFLATANPVNNSFNNSILDKNEYSFFFILTQKPKQDEKK